MTCDAERLRGPDEPDLSKAELFADSARGIYIPQHFAEAVDRSKVHDVTDEQWSILAAGPDHEHYWDVWTEVLDGATLIKDDGSGWYLHQDGDLWIVPAGA